MAIKKIKNFAHILCLLLGPISFYLVINLSSSFGFDDKQKFLIGILVWTMIWWTHGLIPLGVTAMLSSCLAAMLGVGSVPTIFSSYAHPIIFLFLGGFLLAKAMEVHRLDQRLALFLLSRKWVAKKKGRFLQMIFLVTFLLSMWFSNTATTAILVPLVLGVLKKIYEDDADADPEKIRKYQSLFLISVACMAGMGGSGTPVGSPPNILAVGMLKEMVGINISFTHWMIYSMPILVICAVIFYFMIYRQMRESLQRPVNVDFIKHELIKLGPLKGEEIITIIVGILLVTFWMIPGLFDIFAPEMTSVREFFDSNFPESVVSIFFAGLLFINPFSPKRSALKKEHLSQLDWNTLLLFGGGLSLGALMFETGLAPIIGNIIADYSKDLSYPVFITVFVLFTAFFTEFSSNTATANLVIPFVISAAQKSGLDPLLPTLAVTITSNFAFMLPIATPPNAIVFATGKVPLSDMFKIGGGISLIGSFLLIIYFAFIIPWVTGIFA